MGDNNKHKEPFILFKPIIAFFEAGWYERGYILFWLGVTMLLIALTYSLVIHKGIVYAIVVLGLILIAMGGLAMLFN